MELKIDKKLYEDVSQYCNLNNINVEKYCVTAIRKQLALDKFGDLNEKITSKEKTTKELKAVEKPPVFLKEETKVEIPMEITDGTKEEKKKEVKRRTIETK